MHFCNRHGRSNGKLVVRGSWLGGLVITMFVAGACGTTNRERTLSSAPMPASENLGDQNVAAMLNLYPVHRAAQQFWQQHGRLAVHVREFVDSSSEYRDDPWKHEVLYEQFDMAYEIRSRGADGVSGSKDDVVLWGAAGRDLPCFIRHGNGLTLDLTKEVSSARCEELRTRLRNRLDGLPGALRPAASVNPRV
jgi:hypothetical protein